MSPVVEYLKAMLAVQSAREEAGGHLPQEVEADLIDKCDAIWRRMTSDEQADAEAAWLILANRKT